MISLLKKPLLPILLLSLALGAGLQALSGAGQFATGWLAGSLLLAACGTGLWLAWRYVGGGRTLAWMMILAFVLRLGLGAGLSRLLPVIGYTEEPARAGYLSPDAFERDTRAWELAAAPGPLHFGPDAATDQYGGMLAISVLVYRGLSPDAHRAYLILILTAAAAALSLPFFTAAVRSRWGARVAALAGWILVLYPESLYWGSGQMREPFLIALAAIAFWAALLLSGGPARRRLALAALAASLAGLFFFSYVVALAVGGVLAAWIWFELLPEQGRPAWRLIGWISLAAGALVLVGLTWAWLRTSANFELTLTEQSSGWVQRLIERLGTWSRVPLVTVYGVMRPVLPAAVIEPASAYARVVSIARALGWYALAPLLVFSGRAISKTPEVKLRRLMLWLFLAVWIWTFIASARAGGDVWDNPRYRVIFLPWMALLAGWAWEWARACQDRWLGRVFLVEGIFLAFFTEWYLSRYTRLFGRLDFFAMLALIAALSAAVLVWGWASDRRRSQLR